MIAFRTFIVLLICCVTLREDFPSLLFGFAHTTFTSIYETSDPGDPSEDTDLPAIIECELDDDQDDTHHLDCCDCGVGHLVEILPEVFHRRHKEDVLRDYSIASLFTLKRLHI